MSTSEAVRGRIRRTFDSVVAAGLRPGSVEGASDEAIGRFAAEQGVTHVPTAVREVLRLIGAWPGLWFPPTDFGVDSGIGDGKGAARDILRRIPRTAGESAELTDPEGMLVLLMHQGYDFHVVDGADMGQDDPPVWRIVDGERIGKWDSVSAWFSITAPAVEGLRRQLEVFADRGEPMPDWAGDILPRTALTPAATHPGEQIRAIVAGAVADGLRPESIEGASDEQIDAFGADQQVRAIPVAVREALRVAGVRQGMWLPGMEFGVTVDHEAKEEVIELLRNRQHKLRDAQGLLVLAARRQSTYHVVDGADLTDDDPAVWNISARVGIRQDWGSVTGWFAAHKPDIAEARQLIMVAEMDGEPLPSWANDIEPR